MMEIMIYICELLLSIFKYRTKYNKEILNTLNNNKECSSNDEIDITNLSNKTITQLKVIASKLGITINNGKFGISIIGGIKKNDLIEQIKIVYTRKQEILDKQEYYKNLNSFNKEIEFTIKDGIEPQEWLFWKVFRNIVIYNKIMSNMDTHLSTSYHSIISVTNMIQFNQLNVLRDKVISNQYLSFNRYSGNKFYEIFRAIRNDDDQDRLFYQQLFKHYGQYSLEFNDHIVKEEVLIEIGNGLEFLVSHTISSNCLPALQVLIQHYQYIPTNNDLKNAIIFQRFKFVKLLTSKESNFNLQVEEYIIINDIKIMDYLYDEKLIDTQMVEEKLKFLFINLDKSLKIEKCKLKYLIGLSKLILKCNNQITYTVTIASIESFSNSLNKQELKSELSDKSNQIQTKKEMIKKLLQLCYSFSNIKMSQFYYIYFNGDACETYTKSDIGSRQIDNESYKSFLRFADLTLLQSVDYSKEMARQCFVGKSFDQLREPDLLFSHCQDKEKQMEFLNFNIGKIKKGTPLIDQNILFNLVIYNDDLDQIKYVADELGDLIKECPRDIYSTMIKSFIHITNYIRSTLVLEWLFENYYSYFIVDGGAANWCYRSVELLQHYEKLYQIKCKSNCNENNSLIRISVPYQYYDDYRPFNINVLKHIFKSGSNVYYQEETDYNEIITTQTVIIGYSSFFQEVIFSSNYGSENQFEMLKLAYLNFGGIDQFVGFVESEFVIELSEVDYLEEQVSPFDGLTRFIDWLYRNYHDELKNHPILHDNKALARTLVKTGVYNDQQLGCYDKFMESNLNECKTELLDLYLKKNDHSNPNYKQKVNDILLNACSKGKLNTIQHIHHNYSWLLVNKSESNPNGIFTTKELNEFLLSSLANNQLEISDYLFELLFSITKKQFDGRSGHLSKVYYEHKSF